MGFFHFSSKRQTSNNMEKMRRFQSRVRERKEIELVVVVVVVVGFETSSMEKMKRKGCFIVTKGEKAEPFSTL
ncbi:hypothetical protein MTR_4g131835 [Medicago truncatula]|uniref:Uncharacterized protein n=1 Tax=Medicago truncatula TaxID=3880 RepID=A0A072USJ7_MEDTR|nr:hypothetical protein MTR_4g131835 [Medicago truncatula]